MQRCSTCQFESPLGAKFCRQCGAPMFAESEMTGASTRNYGRQEPALAVAASAPLPPSIGDVIGADTSRYHPAPAPAPAFVTPSVNTAPIKAARAGGWRWLVLLLVFIGGLSMGAIVTSLQANDPDHGLTPAEMAERDAEAQLRAQQEQLADQARQLREQGLDAQRKLLEEHQRALDEARQNAEAGGGLVPGAVKPLDLTPYEYPGAAIGNYSRMPGNEMLQMRTKDGFDTLLQFYQKKFGKPLLLMNDEDDKTAIFQSTSAAPAIQVAIEQDEDNDGFWRITVNRAPFHVAQPDAPKSPKQE